MANEGGGSILPLKLLEKCVGTQVWLIMKNEHEFVGTLRGYDDYFNMVLNDVKEYRFEGGQVIRSELPSALLNATQVAIIVPGSEPDY